MQVIAQDLEYASQTANQLQLLLDEREQQLHNSMRQSDLNTNIIGEWNIQNFFFFNEFV